MGQLSQYKLFQRTAEQYKKTLQNGQNTSNQIIVCVQQVNPIVYLPAYLSVKINNIQTIVIEQNLGKLNLTLMFSIYFGNLTQEFIDKVCNQLKLSFARDEQFSLRKPEDKLKQRIQTLNQQVFDQDSDDDQSQDQLPNIQQKYNQKTKIVSFNIRKTFQTNLTPYCFLTPFEIHDLVLGIQVRKCEIQINGINVEVKLNLMSINSQKAVDRSKCINFSQMSTYGQYDLAQTLLLAQNTLQRSHKNLGDYFKPKIIFQILDFGNKFNQVINSWRDKTKNQLKVKQIKSGQQQKQKKQNKQDQFQVKCQKYFENKNFQFCNIHFPMYKIPWTSFLTIYLPLWILSFITLCMFYMRNDYTQRVGAVAALTLAFIPIIQVVRQQIPKISSFSFVEVSVLFQVFGSLLFLVQSWLIRNKGEDYKFNPYTNIFFLTALFITLLFFITPLFIAFIFKFKVQQELNIQLSYIDFKFERNDWIYNYQAQNFFQQKKKLLQQKNSIQGIKPLEQKKGQRPKQKEVKKGKSKLPNLKYVITQKQLSDQFLKMQDKLQDHQNIYFIKNYGHFFKKQEILSECPMYRIRSELNIKRTTSIIQ